MPIPSRDHRRELLRADCANCFGLCCTALSFVRSADFGLDKPAGEPCVHLRGDFGCGIHDRLRSSGFPGCASFDCFGAGQRVAQTTFAGVSWVEQPDTRDRMFAAFAIMRDLHELLWYLSEAVERELPSSLAERIAQAYETILGVARLGPDELRNADVDSHRERTSELLALVSRHVRSTASTAPRTSRRPKGIAPRAVLDGRDLSHADLRGAHLRGASLIAADLRGSDLTAADLLGADLRNARLDGADLSEALFLTQQQASSAKGDMQASLPPAILRPGHWG